MASISNAVTDKPRAKPTPSLFVLPCSDLMPQIYEVGHRFNIEYTPAILLSLAVQAWELSMHEDIDLPNAITEVSEACFLIGIPSFDASYLIDAVELVVKILSPRLETYYSDNLGGDRYVERALEHMGDLYIFYQRSEIHHHSPQNTHRTV